MQQDVVSHLAEHEALRPQVQYTAKVIDRIVSDWLTIKSVLDLGCGIGTWLDVFSKRGQRSVLGVDVENIEASDLVIPQQHFVWASIALPLDLKKKFDLVLLLETAEHIDRKYASTIIDNAARHADLVLFSAAVPGQGGLHHVNEQLPEYWVEMFDVCDFDVFDILRPIIWNDDNIPSWYRQNLLVFSRRSSVAHRHLTDLGFHPSSPPLGRVHPSLLQWYASELAAKSDALAQHIERLATISLDLSTVTGRLAEREAAIERLSADLSTVTGRLAEREAAIERLSADLSMAASSAEREAATEAELSALRQQMQRIGGSWSLLIRKRVKSDTAVPGLAQSALMLPLLLLAPILKPARKRLRRAKTKRTLRREYLTIKHSGLFDAEYYLSAYPDLRGRINDPLMHYLRHGAKEKRNPSRFFDTIWYLRDNPDVAAAGINPVAHFVSAGLAEGRSSIRTTRRSPSQPAIVNGELRNPLKRTIALRLADGLLTWGPEHVSEIQGPFSEPSSALRFLRESELDDAEWSLPTGSRIAVYASTRGNYFFNEIRDLIAQGLREAGYEPIVLNEEVTERCDPAINMVIAPHEFFTLGHGQRWLTDSFLSNSIIVNTEQWQTSWFAKSLPALLRAKRIFDINLQSAAGLRSLGLPTTFLPLGFVPDFAPFSFHARLPDLLALKGVSRKVKDYAHRPGERFTDRPLDIAFIGANTPRREAFFAGHAASFAKYHSFLYLPRSDVPFRAGPEAAMTTEAATGIEQRSKIVLNIHRDDHQYFEWHRIVLHGIWQRSVVVTERSQRVPGFLPGQHYFDADLAEIPEMLEWLLQASDGQAAAESARQSAQAVLSSEYRLSSCLADLLGSSAQSRSVAQPNGL